jgi:uncharacterized protein YjbI with pentapeptide repeats
MSHAQVRSTIQRLGRTSNRLARILVTTSTPGNLTDANLTDGVLVGADFTSAALSYANLTDANLTDANLTDADLTGARLVNMTWSDTICPDGTNSDSDGHTCVGHPG